MIGTLLFVLLCLQDLDGLKKTLRQAVDRSSYEQGAYDAAKQLAQAAGSEAMELRLELFDSKLTTYRGVYLRDWFYTGMCNAKSVEAADLLVQAAANRKNSELLRLLSLRALANCTAQVSAKPLLQKSFLRAPASVRLEWQRSLGLLHSQKRLIAQGKLAQNLDAEVRELLAKAGPPYLGLAKLTEISSAEWGLLLDAAGNAKEPGDRALALRGLAQHMQDGPILEVLKKALRDKHGGPFVAAWESAVQNQIFAAVPLLVDALAELEVETAGRRGVDLGHALMTLTGQRLGYSQEVWQRWWQEQGEDWLKNVEKGELLPAQLVEEAGETAARVFGLPVHSHRISILVDASGSMQTTNIGALTAAEAAHKEVAQLLEKLPSQAKFNLVMVNQAPTPLFKKLVPISNANRKKALETMRKNEYRQRSALIEAYEVAAQDPEIDCILLISDGGSSEGTHQYAGHLFEYLQRSYEKTGIRIHTVNLADNRSRSDFMERLANATGGYMVKPGS